MTDVPFILTEGADEWTSLRIHTPYADIGGTAVTPLSGYGRLRFGRDG